MDAGKTAARQAAVIFRRIRGRFGGWGISRLLIAVLLVTLAPFVVLEAVHGEQDVQRRQDAVDQQAQSQAIEAADVTGEFLGFSQRFLASLAGAPAVRAPDPAGAQALFEAARGKNQNFGNVFLLGADGSLVASSGPTPIDLDMVEQPAFQQALAAGTMAVGSVRVLPGTDRSVLAIGYPVVGDGGARAGVLGLELNIARLSDVVHYLRLPTGSVVLLVQSDGTVIAANRDPERWVGQRLPGLPLFKGAKPPARPGWTSGLMRDGVRRVVAYEPVQGTSWWMLAGIPQAEVDAALRQRLFRVGEEVALAILATAILAWLMLRRVVIPIRTLSDGARAFAAGSLDLRIPLRRRDELGALAEALNGMAEALQRRLQEEATHAEALRALNQLQTEFVATASHELRTPVTAIRTYVEALLRSDIEDEAIREDCLEGLDRSSARLAQLVRTLLDVSRIDGGRVPVQLGPVDPLAAVRAAIEQAAPNGADRTVSVRAAAGLPPVQADRDRLEDTLANLIGNARKFSPPGALIEIDIAEVEIAETGPEVVIAVRDHGLGIPAEELPRIFDRFYQVNRGPGRYAGGAGLGLYIARGYVMAMGGRIWAESRPGAGSTFFVALPSARVASLSSAPTAPERPAEGGALAPAVSQTAAAAEIERGA